MKQPVQKPVILTIGKMPIRLFFDAGLDAASILHKNLRLFAAPATGFIRRRKAASLTIHLCQPPSRETPAIDPGDSRFLSDYFRTVFSKQPKMSYIPRRIAVAMSDAKLFRHLPRFTQLLRAAGSSPERWIVVPLISGIVLFDTTALRGDLFLSKAAAVSIRRANIVNAVAFIVSYCAPLSGSLLLHGAGLLHRGKGYLFLGRSGAGKSTVARLAGRDAAIGDDGIYLGWSRSGAFLMKTPLIQKPSMPGSPAAEYPADGIFFLRKSIRTAIAQRSRTDALRQIMNYHFHFFRFFDIINSENAFVSASNIVKNIGCYTVCFRKNRDFLTAIERRGL